MRRHKHLHKFENMLWMAMKAVLYLGLLFIFVAIMSMEIRGLQRISRTLGITVISFLAFEILFQRAYGRFDIGRRKTRPIVQSLVASIIWVDVLTYVEVMVMRTNGSSMFEFRLTSISLLVAVIVVQVAAIMAMVRLCNWLFFKIHKPENCLIVTSSQRALDEIALAVGRYKMQYKITEVLDYKSKQIWEKIKDVDAVFLYEVPTAPRIDIMNRCYRYRVNVYFDTEIADVMEISAQQYTIDDIFLMNKNVKAMTMGQRIMKRSIDIGLSVILLALTSPLMLVAAIAIKRHDGGPIIFRQERLTLNGRHFEILKFRTMKIGSEARSATKGDDRITKPGKWLRRFRIDELPQLVNVFRGEMSFVGPRPEMIKNIEKYTAEIPEFSYRLRMKAGVTGYAQVMGKYNTSPRDKLMMDLMYIEEFSIMHDLQIMMQTVIVLLKRESTAEFEKKSSGFVFVPADDEE